MQRRHVLTTELLHKGMPLFMASMAKRFQISWVISSTLKKLKKLKNMVAMCFLIRELSLTVLAETRSLLQIHCFNGIQISRGSLEYHKNFNGSSSSVKYFDIS